MGLKDIGKVAMWKMQGMSQEEMAKKLMAEPGVQEMLALVQKGLASGAITKNDLLALQARVMSDPKGAQKELEALLDKAK